MGSDNSTVLLHDFLLVPGGAEAFALHLGRRFPELDSVFGFVDAQAFAPGVLPAGRVRTLTEPSRQAGWQIVKAMHAFRHRTGFIRDYRRVIYSGVCAPLAIHNSRARRNVYYCHTPPRFVYDLRDYYRRLARPWQVPLLAALERAVRPRYEQAVARMDLVLANSLNVKRRLERHLGTAGVQVLHPPVDTGGFRWQGEGDYFLSTARLEPYKRVDLVVRAFRELPREQLVVASGGSQLEALRRLAAGCPNISFTGWCAPERLRALVGQARATVYLPIEEDFGISPVESMAAGKPVIAVAEGGLLETVVPGETGELLAPGPFAPGMADPAAAVAAVVQAVQGFTRPRALAMRGACEARARLFDTAVFDARFRELVLQD